MSDPGTLGCGTQGWVRHLSRRYDAASAVGTVTRVISDQKCGVDCKSPHVRDMRLVVLPPVAREVPEGSEIVAIGDDQGLIILGRVIHEKPRGGGVSLATTAPTRAKVNAENPAGKKTERQIKQKWKNIKNM